MCDKDIVTETAKGNTEQSETAKDGIEQCEIAGESGECEGFAVAGEVHGQSMDSFDNKDFGIYKKNGFWRKKRVLIPVGVLATLTVLYCLFAFAPFRPFSGLRRLYIETAMSTADHQWLATAFLPKSVIEKSYIAPDTNPDLVGGKDALKVRAPGEDENTGLSEENTGKTPVEDILGQAMITVGDKDYAGYTVVINDIEQGIVVSEIEENGYYGTYRGKVMLIDDPSRVYLGTTPYKHVEGLRIKAMMEHHGAIAGINASGFNDPGDQGHGGDVIGLTCSQGEFWGTAVDYYGSVLITENDRLVVGNVSDWQNYAIREGIQFGPVLIADGIAQFDHSGGYGIHPRTAIGQREDGVIVFLIIDGRQLSWSIGCTVSEMIGVLEKYGVVNAACCDGGSSSVMAYRGEVITKNSSKNPDYGRRLPNAWLVRPKETAEVKNDE